jgi:hypothetical protein
VTVAVWLGNAAPVRSIRWLDGALATAAQLGRKATAIVAGDKTWLELASDRATRAGLSSVGISTDLKLDYLGWAQIVAAAVRELKATTVLVDEVSRPERFPEVAAIAEQLDTVQLTRVIALAADGDVLHATRVAGRELQTIRVRGGAVIGIRIAGPAIDEYPTPMPSKQMRKLELPALGLDPRVLGHRGIPPRAGQQTKKSIVHVTEHLGFHLAPRDA